jgi:hypothetical protein
VKISTRLFTASLLLALFGLSGSIAKAPEWLLLMTVMWTGGCLIAAIVAGAACAYADMKARE